MEIQGGCFVKALRPVPPIRVICTLPDVLTTAIYETQGGTLSISFVLECKLVSVLYLISESQTCMKHRAAPWQFFYFNEQLAQTAAVHRHFVLHVLEHTPAGSLPKIMSLRNAHPLGVSTAFFFVFTFLSALRPVLCLTKCVKRYTKSVMRWYSACRTGSQKYRSTGGTLPIFWGVIL